MAKYSTGGSSGSSDGDACELCGTESDSLREANVAGAQLQVCQECAPHDDNAHKDEKSETNQSQGDDRQRRAVQNAAKSSPAWNDDSEHWEEEGTNYDDDQLPYLVSDYGSVLQEARQDAGLQREELAEELDADEADLLAIEQGRATQAGVGGSLVRALEQRLDVELAEST
ncbi:MULTISPECIES: multiprotein-bridging factor 1 family protein [Halostella]|uniref:multiprotein-bridging factor 1 family protein n=1 Tax=Halostella TaxID=1843185 RepID=UPI001080A085|nr:MULTISPECIES: multiprotein-bridging factor 1 family protein [Halostella]